MTGIEAFLEVLAGAGVRHLFGNPGTTELPLNDALARDPRFRYVFGLHEIPVVAMADGYAQATGHVGDLPKIPGHEYMITQLRLDPVVGGAKGDEVRVKAIGGPSR